MITFIDTLWWSEYPYYMNRLMISTLIFALTMLFFGVGAMSMSSGMQDGHRGCASGMSCDSAATRACIDHCFAMRTIVTASAGIVPLVKTVFALLVFFVGFFAVKKVHKTRPHSLSPPFGLLFVRNTILRE